MIFNYEYRNRTLICIRYFVHINVTTIVKIAEIFIVQPLYSTVTLFARLRGLSTSQPLLTAM